MPNVIIELRKIRILKSRLLADMELIDSLECYPDNAEGKLSLRKDLETAFEKTLATETALEDVYRDQND